jgi:hypothetical protein
MQQTRHTRHTRRSNPLRNLWIIPFAAALAALIAAPTARAAYVQLTQTRSLSTTASANLGGEPPTTDADSEDSADLGSFDRSINSSARAFSPQPPLFQGFGLGTASQSVQWAPTSITGSLVGDAQASSTAAEGSSRGDSTWSATFRVDQPTPFDLHGLLSVRNLSNVGGFGGGFDSSSLTLSRQADSGGPEQMLYTVSLPPFPGVDNQRDVDFSGVLDPDYVYRLAANASATRSASSLPITFPVAGQTITEATFTLTTVPEPAAVSVLAGCATLMLRRRRR